MSSPIVCEYSREKCSCKGCHRNVDNGSVRFGLLRGQGSGMRTCMDWYHSACFWEKCPYRNHVRGTNMDRITLVELFEGFDNLLSHDKIKLEQDACKPAEKFKKNHRHFGLNANTDDDVSAEGGDYELDDNTYDITHLVCINVFKHQLGVFVSIREYFKPNDATVAKATRIGIALTADQWHKVCRKRYGIDGALKDIGVEQKKGKKKGKEKTEDTTDDGDGEDDDESQVVFSLSWKRRVSIFRKGKEAVVDIRDFSEEKTFKPAKRGITLSKIQWNKLKGVIDNINYSILMMSKLK